MIIQCDLPIVVPQKPSIEQHLSAAQLPTPGPQVSGSSPPSPGAGVPGIVTLQTPYADWQPVEQYAGVVPQNPLIEQQPRSVGQVNPDALPPVPVTPQVLSGEMTGIEVGAGAGMEDRIVEDCMIVDEIGDGVALGLLGRLPIFSDVLTSMFSSKL